MRPRLRLVSAIAVLAAIYFESGTLGLKLASVHPSATPIWPPTGIALAALLIVGLRAWPGVFLGAFLVNVGLEGEVVTSLGIAAGNTLEAVIGAELVTRFANGRDFFRQTRSLLRFVLFAAMLSTMISATVGAGTLALAGSAALSEIGSIWMNWWLGNATGAVLLTPLILVWHADSRFRVDGRGRVEALLLLGTLCVFGQVVFGAWTPSPAARVSTAFLAVPILLWPACRMGKLETVTAIFLVSMISLIGTLRGVGPFASERPLEALVPLQTFLGVVAVTSMVIAASTAERRRATAELVRYQRELEEANARLNEQCLSDPLTGVANRRAFQAKLADEVERAKRHPAPLALLVIDVDRFRDHNRILGHTGADHILKKIASVLGSEIRKADLLARYGGDEFVILMPNTTVEGGRVTAERCRRSVAATHWERRSVTVSIGAASIRPGMRAEDLIVDADEALFRAKSGGRNRVQQASKNKTGQFALVKDASR
jgi:diguanylate cyclase (GGDEF)-like protein